MVNTQIFQRLKRETHQRDFPRDIPRDVRDNAVLIVGQRLAGRRAGNRVGVFHALTFSLPYVTEISVVIRQRT